MAAPTYNVTLHHLSADAKTAGVNYTNEPLMGVSAAQLRALLQGLSEVASRLTIYEPATPEIRIKTERSAFVVRTRHRRLCLLGWENKLRGEEHTIGLILNAVIGTTDPARIAAEPERRGPASPLPDTDGSTAGNPPMRAGGTPQPGTESNSPFPSAATEAETRGLPRWAKISGLALLIVAFNATTVWLVFFQSAASPVPKSEAIAEFETGALLAKAAGEYETGVQEGDRRLIIEPSGTLRVAKYGPERAILQEAIKTARGGSVNGRVMLITSDPATVEIKDVNTVVYFGTTYRRRSR
ncbi:MAG: hypothetical protein H7343_10410 [Undibacterium sp.]|nr:hypothetical protein [Opitutaceae bacterium]